MAQHSTSDDKTHAQTDHYPQRSSHYAHRFSRLVFKDCVAQRIGTQAVCLLLLVAHTEDAKRYRGPVTYWDGQLLPLLGIRSKATLARTRKRAVEAGWLHYEPGTSGRPGKYWVTTPEEMASVDDAPIDAGDEELFVVKSGSIFDTDVKQKRNGHETDAGQTRNRPADLFYPIPKADPKPDPKARSHTVIPADLSHLIDAWNSLPDGIAPRVVKRDSREILRAWQRASKDPEAGPLLNEPDAVMSAIRESSYLHGQSWFRFAWLLRQDSARVTWNILKVMDGRYRSGPTKAERARRQTMTALEDFIRDD